MCKLQASSRRGPTRVPAGSAFLPWREIGARVSAAILTAASTFGKASGESLAGCRLDPLPGAAGAAGAARNPPPLSRPLPFRRTLSPIQRTVCSA